LSDFRKLHIPRCLPRALVPRTRSLGGVERSMKYLAACLISSVLGGLFVAWLVNPASRHVARAQDSPAERRGPRLPAFDDAQEPERLERPERPERAPVARRGGELIFNSQGLSPDEAIGVAVYDHANKAVVNITTKSVNGWLLLDV